MAAQFTVRRMLPSDLDRLRETVALSFSKLMGFFAVHSLLSQDGQTIVADVQGVAVGFAKLIAFQIGGGKFGCVLWVATHPDFRRMGIASALASEGIRNLKIDGAQAVFASTQGRNARAMSVLSRVGFRRVGFRELWRLFGGRVFQFYSDIWLAPGEVILMHS